MHSSQIGAGLLAGAAAIGTLIGAGVFAYKRHKERSGRYQPRVAWVSNEGQDMPRDAIQGGEERGERLFICRAPHEVCPFSVMFTGAAFYSTGWPE